MPDEEEARRLWLETRAERMRAFLEAEDIEDAKRHADEVRRGKPPNMTRYTEEYALWEQYDGNVPPHVLKKFREDQKKKKPD